MNNKRPGLYNDSDRPYRPTSNSVFSGIFSFLKKAFKKQPPKKPQKPGSKKRPSLRWVILKTFLSLGVWLAGCGLLAVLWFSYDLPDIHKLQTSVRKPGVVIQAMDGSVIGSYGDLHEDTVRISELPSYVPQALMAVEDRRFYSHFGIDVIGLFRAAYTNYKADRVVQGGSTLTQQLAKNFLFTQGLYDIKDKSLRRKVQEAIMAIWLEWTFTKDQILSIYLNRVYFGAGTYGIDAAARTYFNKPAKMLTVYEAAVIAGLLKAPSKYSPAHHPQRARARATVVLKQMQEAGYITSAEEYLNQQPQITQAEVPDDQGSKYFADWVYETIPSLIGGYDQDLVVITTLDPRVQRYAEVATHETMDAMAKEMKTTEIGLLAMTPKGAVRAMVGGMKYRKSQYNHTTQALRQPGSSFKPFVYLAALEAGFTPESMISDTPISIGTWSPKNFRYKGSAEGQVSMMYALTKSVNTVTVRLAQHVGGHRIAAVAHRLGITSDMMTDLSIALGTTEVNLLELTGAFATFANKGNSVWSYGIVEIRNRAGDILYQHKEDEEETVAVAPRPLYNMLRMLISVVDSGTGGAARLKTADGKPIQVAGKTGSNADKDAWFVGMTSDLVAGVWTGNDNNSPMNKNSVGGRLPTKAWAAFMKAVVADNPPAAPLLPGPPPAEEGEELLQLVDEGASQAPAGPPPGHYVPPPGFGYSKPIIDGPGVVAASSGAGASEQDITDILSE